jgi:two-component system sensor histidine kinase AlgZ
LSRELPLAAPAGQTRVEAASPTPVRVVPDGCNLGVLLRVLLAVHAVAALIVWVEPAATSAWSRFVAAAGFAAPITLLTLVAWCLLRRLLPPMAASVQRALAWMVAPLWVAVVLALLAGPALALTPMQAAGYVVLGAAAGAAGQHYLELRERAFSPVLAEARFQALQSRIRPHFFFNSLTAVLAVLRDDPARAERMLESIAELFRAVMADVRKLVPVEQELDLCRRYVEIEQTRLGDRLHVDWRIGAIHPRARVPQLLLQPIVENAVRYGAEKVEGRCEILVRIKQHGATLKVFVSNPIAREPVQREGNQIGLSNIRGRLALIYDLEAELLTRVRHDRFELALRLPVEHKT